MDLLNTLRKFCPLKSVRDKTKREPLLADKYEIKMKYVGVSLRDITHTLTNEQLKKEVEKNIEPYIRGLSKESITDLNSLYEDVKHSKNTFRESVKSQVWSDFQNYGNKTDIVYHGFKRLQDATSEEIRKRNNKK